MKIRKHILLAGLILAAVCLLGGCAKTSTGSGIVQRRMGSGNTAAQQTALGMSFQIPESWRNALEEQGQPPGPAMDAPC